MKNWMRFLLIPLVAFAGPLTVLGAVPMDVQAPVQAPRQFASLAGDLADLSVFIALHRAEGASAFGDASLRRAAPISIALPAPAEAKPQSVMQPRVEPVGEELNAGLLLMGGLMVGMLVIRRFPR